MTNGCCTIKITLNNTNKKGDEQRENKIYKKIERTIVECFCYLFIDMRFLFILACCTSVEYLRLMRFFIETRVDNKKKEKKMNFKFTIENKKRVSNKECYYLQMPF